MKVLLVNSVFNVKSTGRIVKDICDVLTSQGHQPYVAYGRGTTYPGTYRISGKPGFLLHLFCTRFFDLHGLLSFFASLRLLHIIRRLKPDIIHLHNIHGYYLNYPLLFGHLKKTKIPVIWTLHDCWSFTGHCPYFTYVACDKWRTGCHACPQKNGYPASWFLDMSRLNYRLKARYFGKAEQLTVVTPSQWLARLVRQSFLADHEVLVINNGIDTDRFRPVNDTIRKRLKLESSFVILGVASDWSKRKGLEYLLQMMELLPENCVLILVGKVNQKIESSSRIIHVPLTDSVDELVELYSACDVFVNPTLEDNFPTTNIEAMACGTPVITFDSGGSPESVTPLTGVVVPPGDIQGLVSAVIGIQTKGKNWYTRSCVELAKSKYSKNDRYLDYVQVYNDILGEKSPEYREE